MPKAVGYFKENGKTKPITRRKSGGSKISKSTSSLQTDLMEDKHVASLKIEYMELEDYLHYLNTTGMEQSPSMKDYKELHKTTTRMAEIDEEIG